MLFQILLVAFAVFAIAKTWKQYRARRVSKYWFFVFTLFWGVVAGVAITPQTTDVVAEVVGVGRGADLLVYVGVVALFYLAHRLMLKQEQLSDEMTELVRKIAVESASVPRPASGEETVADKR
jgi:small membrane protein